jgi:hypothetical protein
MKFPFLVSDMSLSLCLGARRGIILKKYHNKIFIMDHKETKKCYVLG